MGSSAPSRAKTSSPVLAAGLFSCIDAGLSTVIRIELNDTYRSDPLVDKATTVSGLWTSPGLQNEEPRRSGAPLALLVPCFLARTRPPAIHAASTSEPAAPGVSANSAAGSTAGWRHRRQTSGYGHLTRSRPQDSANFLQTHDQGPAGFVALPPIRQSSTWEVAPRGGMVARGGESHSGNEPGRSTCAGPGPLLPVSFAIRLTTAPLPGTAQAVGRQKKAPPAGAPAGQRQVGFVGLFRTNHELQPLRSVTQADSAQERPRREAGAGRRWRNLLMRFAAGLPISPDQQQLLRGLPCALRPTQLLGLLDIDGKGA